MKITIDGGGFLHKSAGIAAAAAQGVGTDSMGEAVIESLCSWRLQNGVKVPPKQVSKRNIAIVVQTTGDHRSVCQNAKLVPQTVTEETPGSFRCFRIRPIKFVSRLQKNTVSNSRALFPGNP